MYKHKLVTALVKNYSERYWAFVSIGAVVFFSFMRQDLFFGDYAIIWDAAYRLNEGHKIYKDFSTPTGPTSFFIPYLAFKIFGYSYTSLKIAQVFISISMVFAYKFLLDAASNDSRIKLINYWSFLAFFVLPLGFPWYNTTAFMFFLWAAVLVLRGQAYFYYLVAGILITLSILSKQDYGLLGLAVCVGLVFVKEFNTRAIVEALRVGSFKSLLLIIASLIPVVLYTFLSDDFADSFNYGSQYGGTAIRFRNLFKSGTSYIFILATLISLYIYSINKSLLLALSVMLLLFASIVRSTSGLSHISATFYVGAWLTIVLNFFNKKSVWGKALNRCSVLLISILSIFLMLHPIRNISNTVLNSFNKKSALTFNYKNVKVDELNALDDSSKSVFINQDSKDFIRLVDGHINGIDLKHRNKISMFNSTELSFLNHYFSIPTPKGFPLWFHDGITFGKKDYQLIKKLLDVQSFDVVLIAKNQTFLFDYYSVNGGYNFLSSSLYLSPSGSEIVAFVKK